MKVSASSLKLSELCLSRWVHKYVAKTETDEDDSGEAAELGNFIHREMELYGKLGLTPTHPAALKLVEYAPLPETAHCEVPVSFELLSGPFIGYIDVAAIDDTLVTLFDWKTTSNVYKYAKSEAELREDVAVNLYAWGAFEAGASEVLCSWIYVQTTKPWTVRDVSFWVDRAENASHIARIDANAAVLQRLKRLNVSPGTVEKNTGACWAFGKRCPYFDACERPKNTVKLSRTLGTKRELPMTNKDFIAHVNAVTAPPAPRIPPPLPPVPAVPPAPPPLPMPEATQVQKNAAKIDGAFKALFDDHLEDTAVGVPEVGFVNPPGGPAVAPKTPEEAAAIQGIEPPVVHDDQLEEADLATLKTIAKTLGIELPPRTRSKAYVEAIRAARSEVLSGTDNEVAAKILDGAARLDRLGEPSGETKSLNDPEFAQLHNEVFGPGGVATKVYSEGAPVPVKGMDELFEENDQAYRDVGMELQRTATLLGATITLSWSPEKSK
jgi:hypothetical protein